MSMRFSHSSVKKFRRCKRQYYYSVVEKLEPRLPDVKLKWGNWFHEVMHAYYSGKDWRKTHARLLKQFNNLFLEEREMYGDLPAQVERAMEAYLYHYRKEEEDWEVLYVEEDFDAEFVEGDVFSFRPDLVVRDHGVPGEPIWVVDHKTVKSLPSAEWRLVDLQSTMYPWAMREMGFEVTGFMFNYIRRKTPTVPSINKDGSISRRRIDTDYYTMAKFLLEYFEVESVNDLPLNWKKQLAALKVQNKFFKRSKIVKDDKLVGRQVEEFSYTAQEIEIWHQMHEDQEIDPWVRTMIPSCEWDCEFYDLCQIELLGGDGRFMRRAKYQPSRYIEERKVGRGKRED